MTQHYFKVISILTSMILVSLSSPLCVLADDAPKKLWRNSGQSVDVSSSVKKSLLERLWQNAGALYKPPLPEPGFLNAEQKHIADTIKPTVAALVEFYDPGQVTTCEYVPVRYSLKKWRAEEKEDISRIVARLLEIAPGLLINAASGEKLLFCRNTTGMRFTSATSGNEDHNAAAVAFPGAIVISDRFFTTHHQFHGLVHEMVHESDCAGRFCYSKEWVDLINPTISDARIRFANSPIYEVESIKNELNKKGIVPTAYACESVVEALAELISSEIDGTFVCGEKFKQVTSKFLVPDSSKLKVDLQYKVANGYFEKKQYAKADEVFSALVKADPDLPSTHGHYGSCLTYLNKYKESLSELKTAMRLFEARGVPYTDNIVAYTNQHLVNCFHHLNDNKDCIDTISKILSKQPLSALALYERFYSYRKEKDFVGAAPDLYFCCFGKDYELILRDADANLPLIQQYLDGVVAKFPNFSPALLRRGHFYEWLGDRETDAARRTEFLQKALSDYQPVLKGDSSNSSEAALDCCNVYIKLGKRTEAEQLSAKWTAKQPDSYRTAHSCYHGCFAK